MANPPVVKAQSAKTQTVETPGSDTPSPLSPSLPMAASLFSVSRLKKFFAHDARGEVANIARALRRDSAIALARDTHGQDALTLSAVYGHIECVRTLLPWSAWDSQGFDLFIKPQRSALVCAAQFGHSDCLLELIAHCPPAFLEHQASQALLFAALGNHVSCVEALLPHADPETFWTSDHSVWEGKNALHLAAANDCTQCIDLLARRIDPRTLTRGYAQRTALMLAAEAGHVDCVRPLLVSSDPNAMVERGYATGFTALMIAIAHLNHRSVPGAVDSIKLLWAASDTRLLNADGRDAFGVALGQLGRFQEKGIDVPGLWAVVDFAAPQVPRSQALQALALVPTGALPQFCALLEREALTQALQPARIATTTPSDAQRHPPHEQAMKPASVPSTGLDASIGPDQARGPAQIEPCTTPSLCGPDPSTPPSSRATRRVRL